MAKKVGNGAGSKTSTLIIPSNVQGDPDRTAMWVKRLAKKIAKTGEMISAVGGQRSFKIPGADRPVVAKPEDACDRIEAALAEAVSFEMPSRPVTVPVAC